MKVEANVMVNQGVDWEITRDYWGNGEQWQSSRAESWTYTSLDIPVLHPLYSVSERA